MSLSVAQVILMDGKGDEIWTAAHDDIAIVAPIIANNISLLKKTFLNGMWVESREEGSKQFLTSC